MYTLLSGLYKYVFQKDEYCVLILGLDNAGKTTFLEQSKTRFSKNYKGMSLSKITTTVGLNIGTVDVGKARLMFWDLGGQEELQSLWDKFLSLSGFLKLLPTSVLVPSTISLGTTRSVMVSSTSSIPQTREDCRSLSALSRRWSPVRLWTVSPSWCWPTSRMLSKGVREGIEWMVKCVVRNVHRPPRQRDIT
ncbi:ADP-ribosylation factor-related protein 1 isoform X4 [Molossus molossus]|uniref:ADP-ribosylation factor-related protein 1 isoform X4 n=1 Tax=Molossus molossus TaxID=27622 RepID=UPI0017476C3A|nr:ADP-ribosylation factor-related protein 1 isoform X4 [Molossus molossus]